MSESQLQTVSSLVDSYQQSAEDINDVINDEQLSDTWNRYHLIGDVIREEMPQLLPEDFSASIADVIAGEPTVLAPQSRVGVVGKIKNNVVKLVKPFGQVAIAASAAGLMVVGVQTNIAQNDELVPSPVVQPMPLGGIAQPVSFDVAPANRVSQQQAFVEQQRRFHALLNDHKQQVKINSATESVDKSEKVEEPNK